MRGKARGAAAMKSTRQAPKNPRKNNIKKTNNADMLRKLCCVIFVQNNIESFTSRIPEY